MSDVGDWEEASKRADMEPRPSDIPTTPQQPAVPSYPPTTPPPAVPQPMRRPPVNYQPQEYGWWLAADGLWYPPETAPGAAQPPPPMPQPAIQNPAQGSQNVVVNVGAPYGQAPMYQQPAYVTGPPKSKVAAGLLALFLGTLGIHRFYLGYTGVGLTMLLITLLSAFILSPIVAVWALIEAIVIFTGGMPDSKGRPLT